MALFAPVPSAQLIPPVTDYLLNFMIGDKHPLGS